MNRDIKTTYGALNDFPGPLILSDLQLRLPLKATESRHEMSLNVWIQTVLSCGGSKQRWDDLPEESMAHFFDETWVTLDENLCIVGNCRNHALNTFLL